MFACRPGAEEPIVWPCPPRLPTAARRRGTLSLHKARRPRGKRTLYAEKAVPEYWVVDIDERSIERWRPDDSPVELLAESLQWQPDRDVPPLVVDLPSYFDRVHGLA